MSRSRHAAFAAFGLASLCARIASAGNDDQLPVGSEAALYGGAVLATVSDGAAGYHNPAGLARNDRNQIDATITAVGLRLYSDRSLLQGASGELAGGTTSEIVIIPTATTFTRRFSKTVVGSFGIFSPRTQFLILQRHLHLKDPTPAGTDWNVAVSSIVYTYLLGPSVAWQASRRFSLGFSLHGLYHSEDTSLQGSGGDADGSLPQSFLAQSHLTSRTTLGLQAGLGFQWQSSDEYRVGFSMQSPGMQLISSASDTAALGFSSPSAGPSLYRQTAGTTSHNGFRAVLPLRMGLGVARLFDWGRIELDATLQSGLPENDLYGARKPVINGRLGAGYALSETMTLTGGIFSDRAGGEAVTDLAAVDMYGAALGLAIGKKHALAPTEAASSLVFGSMLAVRYAYGRGHTTALAVGSFEQGALPVTDASTPMSVHELTVSLGSDVNF